MTMKGANFLEKLLDGQKVEWKKLGEVCNVLRGRRLTKKDMIEDGEYLVYQNSMIPLGRYNKYNVKGGTTYVICAGSAGEIGYSSEDFWAADDVSYFECPEFVHSKFLYYYLLTQQQRILRQVRKAGVPRLAPDVLRQLPIPLPSLSVQSRIVEILDKFTSLEAELEAEQSLRTKQYQHYREQLLLCNPLSTFVPLGELGQIRMCRRIMKNQTTDIGDIPFYKIGTFGGQADAFISRTLFEEYKNKYFYPSKGDILVSASGTIGRVIEFDGKDAYFQDSNIVWLEHDETKVLNRYLFYCYQIAEWKVAKGGIITRLYNDNFRRTEIPLPPISEQARIVEILDKFDALTNSITEGLPLEIKLRKQQYEYYREQLLNFPHH